MKFFTNIFKAMADKNNNTGNRNTGNWNTGNWNTGNWNTGDWSTGNRNTGNWNTGNWNTGNRNTGNWNTGDWNTGNRNTGNLNTGNRNTGNWNTGDWNTGIFNTNEPKMRAFNKDSNMTMTEFRSKHGYQNIAPLLTEWIDSSNMSKGEKDAHPEHGNTGGYLKKHDYKTAWKTAWDKATQKDRDWFLNLPNFDADIFFEVTGIDVRVKEESFTGEVVEVTFRGQKLKAVIQ